MYHGKALLPITQYGQAELDIKMALYSDGKRRKSKYSLFNLDGTMKLKKLLHPLSSTMFLQQSALIRSNTSYVFVFCNIGLYRLDELTSQMNNFVPEDPDLRSPSP